jgi:predicted membrane protein
MERHDHAAGFRANPGIIPALVVIGVGVLFLLNNLNLFYMHDVWRFWPVILIAAGLAKLVDSPFEGGRNNGIVLVAIGAILLINTLGFIHLTWADFWPVILIGAGLLMLVNRLAPIPLVSTGSAPSGVPADGLLNLHAVFGGVERKVNSDDFRGGHITAMFGGVDLNLRKAGMTVDTAVIDINVMFGGVDIKIPPNWLVILDGAMIFGGFSDKSVQPSPDMPGVKRLIVKGVAMFGGVGVKN